MNQYILECRADFPGCRFWRLSSRRSRNTGLESPVNRQAGKPALHRVKLNQRIKTEPGTSNQRVPMKNLLWTALLALGCVNAPAAIYGYHGGGHGYWHGGHSHSSFSFSFGLPYYSYYPSYYYPPAYAYPGYAYSYAPTYSYPAYSYGAPYGY